MTFRHYTASEVEILRASYPGHFLVEIATSKAACVIAIADTPENRDKAIPLMPGMTADLLDGNTIVDVGEVT
jgi:hypothetical protein